MTGYSASDAAVGTGVFRSAALNGCAVPPDWLEEPWRRDRWLWLAKRALDVVGAILLLVLTAPLVFLAILAIRLSSPGPVFFVQRRIGYHCRGFDMYKLRTMVQGAEEMEPRLARSLAGRTFLKIEQDPRRTPLGRLLRKLSIDELPQLVNVLRGEMSMVGPRPLLPSDFAKFPRRQQIRRFSVLPGLTGLWQTHGRSTCTDAERIALDLAYVDNLSFALDMKILARTIPTVISGKGAY